jgi:hypothetical protein
LEELTAIHDVTIAAQKLRSHSICSEPNIFGDNARITLVFRVLGGAAYCHRPVERKPKVDFSIADDSLGTTKPAAIWGRELNHILWCNSVA